MFIAGRLLFTHFIKPETFHIKSHWLLMWASILQKSSLQLSGKTASHNQPPNR